MDLLSPLQLRLNRYRKPEPGAEDPEAETPVQIQAGMENLNESVQIINSLISKTCDNRIVVSHNFDDHLYVNNLFKKVKNNILKSVVKPLSS